MYGFNKELYHNMSEAQHKAQGIVGISVMVQIGETPNAELRIITSTFNKVLYKGMYKNTHQLFNLRNTYSGHEGKLFEAAILCKMKFSIQLRIFVEFCRHLWRDKKRTESVEMR